MHAFLLGCLAPCRRHHPDTTLNFTYSWYRLAGETDAACVRGGRRDTRFWGGLGVRLGVWVVEVCGSAFGAPILDVVYKARIMR